jgi:hypothetical protein
VKTNLTMRIDEDLVRQAKVLAARQGTSVSHLISRQLEELTRRDQAFDAARQRAQERLMTGFDLQWTPAENREELHDRARLRR